MLAARSFRSTNQKQDLNCSAVAQLRLIVWIETCRHDLNKFEYPFCAIQLSALKAQYAMLEEEYVTSRTLAKKKMNKYVAEQAAVKMDEYLEQLKKLRASLTEQHPVSV